MHYSDMFIYLIEERLIETPSKFTHESLKAYKSLEAYNYFISGYVKGCVFYQIPNSDFCFIRAKVHAGQRPNSAEAEKDAWVCLNKSGEIATANCTCMHCWVYF